MALPGPLRRNLLQPLILTLSGWRAACSKACRTAYARVYGTVRSGLRRAALGFARRQRNWTVARTSAWSRWRDRIVDSRAAQGIKTLKELSQNWGQPAGRTSADAQAQMAGAVAPDTSLLRRWGGRLLRIIGRILGFSGSANGPRGGLEPALARRLLFGLSLIGVLALSCGVWAATTPIAGAVIASGIVVVESNIKKVQHPTGGIVAEIPVKNGDKVKAGDIVLKLDDTQARANLGIVVSQLVQLTGRKARLEAERDKAEVITFPPDFLSSGEEAAAIAEGEKRLFDFRRTSKQGQVAQLTERVGQIREEIKGITAQRDAKTSEIDLMIEELDRLEVLRKKDLMASNRILASQRDLTRLKGEWGQLVAQGARALGQISETELQILALDQTMQTESSKELREMEARMAELAERRIAAQDQLVRIIMRAPQSGIVHDLAVYTVQGVIGPGEAVMMIVPNEDDLSIEVRIATSDIDQVHVGQVAHLRFPAFNQRTTPEIKGQVVRVGADLTKEAQTNQVFYTARVRIDEDQRNLLKLIPGMPVEAFIATGERTALSYLVKPVTDQFSRAFRER
jgi:HlyD family secretion protein